MARELTTALKAACAANSINSIRETMSNPIKQMIRDKYFKSDEEFEEALEKKKKVFDEKFSYFKQVAGKLAIEMWENLVNDKKIQAADVMVILTMISTRNIAIIASELPDQAIGHFLDEMITMIKAEIRNIKQSEENATD